MMHLRLSQSFWQDLQTSRRYTGVTLKKRYFEGKAAIELADRRCLRDVSPLSSCSVPVIVDCLLSRRGGFVA